MVLRNYCSHAQTFLMASNKRENVKWLMYCNEDQDALIEQSCLYFIYELL